MSAFQKKELRHGEHIGSIILRLRNERHLTPEQLSALSSVPAKYIIAFEQYRYQELPGKVYAKNFLRSIAEACEINAERLTQRFEDDWSSFPFEAKATLPNEVATPSFWTPRRLRALLIVIVLIVGLGYVALEVSGFFVPPELQITAPQDSIQIPDTHVLVEGRTQKGATVTVNGANVNVDDAGAFSADVDLTPGVNTLTIVATHKYGRQSRVVRTILARP